MITSKDFLNLVSNQPFLYAEEYYPRLYAEEFMSKFYSRICPVQVKDQFSPGFSPRTRAHARSVIDKWKELANYTDDALDKEMADAYLAHNRVSKP